jgi:anaerobic magnesium-protoporphyrin IX monomethyl ester cyclase
MKITFVHFGREHLGIEYLSAVLKRAGHEVFLAHDPGLFSLEDNVFHIPPLEKFFNRKKSVLAAIEKSNPDIVAFSVYSGTYQWAIDVAGAVKKKIGAKTVFGGAHATLVPEVVIKNGVVDYVIEGEGEGALLDLVETLSSKKETCNIPNIWYRKNGAVIQTPVRPPIDDLDSLPMPDKELFENEINHGDDYMIMTSRGCKFSCNYCCESFMHSLYVRKYFRRRSISSVMHELTEMKRKYHFKRVMFFDSVFFTDKKWLKAFLEDYKRNISVPFRCEGHVSFADDNMIQLMKDAGCYGIDFGIQTFNEDVRKKFLNRFETNGEIRKAFNACDKARLRYDVDLILALPLMKEEDYVLSLQFIDSPRYLNRIKCFNFCYYPKLLITQKAKELGIINDGDIKCLEEGESGDFFHVDSIKHPADKRMKDNFEKLYKIYPLLPRSLRRYVIRNKLYRYFRFLPKPLVILTQLIIGIFKNDLRFYTYIKYYFIQFIRRFGYRHN